MISAHHQRGCWFLDLARLASVTLAVEYPLGQMRAKRVRPSAAVVTQILCALFHLSGRRRGFTAFRQYHIDGRTAYNFTGAGRALGKAVYGHPRLLDVDKSLLSLTRSPARAVSLR